MAEKRSSVKNGHQSVVTQLSKRPSSSGQTQRSTRVKETPGVKPASAPTHKHANDLWAKEKKYKLRNAEIEAKTAILVKQADKIMRQQSDILSKPLSTLQLTDSEDEEANRMIKPQQFTVRQQPEVKVVTRKAVQLQNVTSGKEFLNKTVTLEVCAADDLVTVKDSADHFLTNTIRRLEENMDGTCENVVDDEEHAADCGEADVSVPVLKANLRIMQEELDELSFDCLKKDDEHVKLIAKMKAVEEVRSGLQRTVRGQQAQIEKHRAAAEESARKCDALQVQVSRLRKEIDCLNRSQKQAAALQSTAEVRLTRAQEEVERLKTQLSKTNQTNKDKIKEEQQTQENLLAENKLLKKQKTELIVGFKKQLKLIDILKRQKMHFEAAKLLSFTEDEFMKALDWGNSHPA